MKQELRSKGKTKLKKDVLLAKEKGDDDDEKDENRVLWRSRFYFSLHQQQLLQRWEAITVNENEGSIVTLDTPVQSKPECHIFFLKSKIMATGLKTFLHN